ncbi:hypothetical protein UUC_07401 [Rhodanobacter denitrificans]|nr:hypothetical protein UUC_07401 [Rhodanobacter denitrificans]
MQPRRFVAIVFFVDLVHLAWRDMSCTQLLRSEMAPHVDIDAMTVLDTKRTLGRAHQDAYALAHRIDQMNAGRGGRIGSGHSADGLDVLGMA